MGASRCSAASPASARPGWPRSSPPSAAAQGATVVWGRCYEGRGAPAFWPWTQVVNGVLARLDKAEGRAALGSAAADVAQIVPEVGELVADLPPLPPLDPEAARFRLYQAVSAFVRRVASRAPLVIVIDDLHWADEASLQLVAFLAVEMSAAPVFVVATYRNVDPTMGDPLADTLVELSRRSVVRRLDLVGLDRGGLARFLTAAGTDPDDELLNTVHRRTQGNPFFVTEILRLLPRTTTSAARCGGAGRARGRQGSDPPTRRQAARRHTPRA